MKRKDVFSLIGVLAVAVLFGAALSLAGCNNPTTPDPIVSYEFCEVDKIININTKGVAGVPFDLNTAVVKPVGATHKNVVWTVRGDDDGKVGITTENIIGGKFTPQNTGELKLLATVADGLGADFSYTQTVNLTFIDEADYVSTSGIAGVRTKAVAGVLANLATDKVVVMPNDSYFATYTAIEWAVKDAGTTGAKIVSKSILKTKAAGTVTVTAAVAYGRSIETEIAETLRDFMQEFTIEVLAADPDGKSEDDFYEGVDKEPTGVAVTLLTLSQTALTMTKGQSITLTATTIPAGVPVTWVSSKPGAFSVSNGTVTAITGGVAQIKAMAGGKSAVCTVTVAKSAGLYIGDNTDAEAGVTGLAASIAWIKDNGANDQAYTIVLGESEEFAAGSGMYSYAGYIIGTHVTSAGYYSSTGDKRNLTITLQGTNSAITIEKKAAGALFTVYGYNADDVPHLILENITLKGFNSNDKALVVIGDTTANKTGNLTMNTGSRITGNESSAAGSGVSVLINSTFIMNDGKIDNNKTTASNSSQGGGVYNNGTFKMINGSIDHNIVGSDTAAGNAHGGGVYSANSSSFEMSGGTISNNEARTTRVGSGGGVFAAGNCTISGSALIKDNTATQGGGVLFAGGADKKFTVSGGSIVGNEANLGGGILAQTTNATALALINGGTISGNKAETAGAAIYVVYTAGKTIFSLDGGTVYSSTHGGALANCGKTLPSSVHAIETGNVAFTGNKKYYDTDILNAASTILSINSSDEYHANWVDNP